MRAKLFALTALVAGLAVVGCGPAPTSKPSTKTEPTKAAEPTKAK